MGRNYSNKNLSILEIGNIEFYLNQGKGYTEIGKILHRTEATIRLEVKKGFKTPLQLLEEEFGKEILDLLNLHHIPIDQLNMKDMIINKL